MKKYKIAAPIFPKQPKVGKLKYLVMIFKRGKRNEFGFGKFQGFLNEKCQSIGQYFTGKEKLLTGGAKIVQLPHLFDTKKKANEIIKQSKEHDKGFKIKNIYEIVPINISIL